jgi:DNA-binding transcriptional LysR family regulator
MSIPDLNLILALDALLAEASVVRAADRLGLSASAMSRTLTRLRQATGDPLLVRAGRGLVPTPRAIELRDRTAMVVQEAKAVLRPDAQLNLRSLERVFSLRMNDGFVERFGPALVARVQTEAPGVVLRFAPKPDKTVAPLRDAAVDLEVGVIGETGPELRIQTLFRDRFIGVVRIGHPLIQRDITPAHFTKFRHIGVSRRGRLHGPIDDALMALGLERRVTVLVSGFPAALALARTSDLVASVPERQTEGGRDGMHSFALPVKTPDVVITQLWHPRLDGDLAHRWLRGCIREVVTATSQC